MEHPQPEAPSRTAPIFIVGANRSGTTLLRLMLNAHSHIAIPEELVYFPSYYAGVPIKKWRAPGLWADDYETLVREFVNNASSPHPEHDPPGLIDTILADGHGDVRRPY